MPSPPQKASPQHTQPPDPRETAEYKAAMELEMWKEQQAGHFEHEVGSCTFSKNTHSGRFELNKPQMECDF